MYIKTKCISLFFARSCWMLKYVYLSSASLQFDSRLVYFITTLKGLGFCSVSLYPRLYVFPSLIILVISSFTSRFTMHTSLHNPPTISMYIHTLSSFRFFSGSEALNITKFVFLFFLSLSYFLSLIYFTIWGCL